MKSYYEDRIEANPEWEQLVKDADAKRVRREPIRASSSTKTENLEMVDEEIAGPPSPSSSRFSSSNSAINWERGHTRNMKSDEEVSKGQTTTAQSTLKALPCRYCSRTFSAVMGRDRHCQKAHPGIRYTCSECGYCSAIEDKTKWHREAKHPGIVTSK